MPGGVIGTKKKCPHCGHTKTWSKGLFPTVKGPRERRICLKCGRTWYVRISNKEKTERGG